MKFRKKGSIEAVRVTEAWFDVANRPAEIPASIVIMPYVKTAVFGDGGKLSAKLGDWVIVGPKIYPMHDEQLRDLYEECFPMITMNEENKMKTRCKVWCNIIEPVEGGFKANFQACYSGSKENEEFFHLTPCINFDLQTLKEQSFVKGKEYYLDITEAYGNQERINYKF